MSVTPAEAAALLEKFTSDGVAKAQFNAIRSYSRFLVKKTIDGIRTKGVGRALWGAKRKGATLMVRTAPIRKVGTGWKTGVHLKGLAAMMELGGRTEKHPIKGNLSFLGTHQWAGRTIRTQEVNHPGSPIPATPTLEPTARANEGVLKEFQERALVKAAGKLMG